MNLNETPDFGEFCELVHQQHISGVTVLWVDRSGEVRFTPLSEHEEQMRMDLFAHHHIRARLIIEALHGKKNEVGPTASGSWMNRLYCHLTTEWDEAKDAGEAVISPVC